MRKIGSLTTFEQFVDYLSELQLALPIDKFVLPAPAGPLAQPLQVGHLKVGNRFAILPMEGWDGTTEGLPSELTLRRWRRFGQSGAKLIWGGEAVAVAPDARANPRQLLIGEATLSGLEQLRGELLQAHRERFGQTDDLLFGLQLTHSGRFSRPHGPPEPKIVYHHPILDRVGGLDREIQPLSDDDIERITQQFVAAAGMARRVGFDFVDIKHCHGYLGHELLSAVSRPGRFGGSFENRTRFLHHIVDGIRGDSPDLQIAVRVSIADTIPFRPDSDHVGRPESCDGCYPFAFGGDGTGTGFNLSEPHRLLELFRELGIGLVCISLGSPYYNPHIQRPAWYPPSDGYHPPEDPLIGVARHLSITAELKQQHPDLIFVGSGYSYLQQWLGNVAQGAVSHGWVDSVGIGRMALSYPELPADLLNGSGLQSRQWCRTFSDCTTAPRNGLVSGCYPLDDYYRQSADHARLQSAKRGHRAR
jgi:2,4-dienoyl-CoA reductase-like NADH-dependent reductase (Old Yellow Enzyme family)